MYIKRHASSRRWKIKRKHGVFTIRPRVSGHRMETKMSLITVLKETLRLASTSYEARSIIRNGHLFVNGKRVRKFHESLGLLDVFSIPKINKMYIMILSSSGYLVLDDISDRQKTIESMTSVPRVVKIVQKVMISRDKYQITTHDGHSRIIDSGTKYFIGDSLLVDSITNKIIQYLPMEPGAYVRLTSSKSSWKSQKIKEIDHESRHAIFEDGTRTKLQNVIVVSEDLYGE